MHLQCSGRGVHFAEKVQLQIFIIEGGCGLFSLLRCTAMSLSDKNGYLKKAYPVQDCTPAEVDD